LFCIIAVGLPGSARGQGENNPTVYFGEVAAMVGGALSAVTDEAEAAWYNPAGLGAIRRRRVSLSGGSLLIRMRSRPAMLAAAGEPDKTAGDEHTYAAFLPVGMGFASALSDSLTVGVVGFLRDRDLFETQATLQETTGVDSPDGQATSQTELTLLTMGRRLDFGAGIGWHLTPRLRVGVAAFVGLKTNLVRLNLSSAPPPASGLASGRHLALGYDYKFLQGYGTLGLQWNFFAHWHIGVVWRTAEVVIWSKESVSDLESFDTVAVLLGQGTATRLHDGRNGYPTLGTVLPPRLRLALAYRRPRGWVNVEADFSPRHRDEDRGLATRMLWNARVGGRVWLGSKVALGGGLFTARSGSTERNGLGDSAIDYYGFASGIQLRIPHRVSAATEPLVFSSTVAFRYALGTGQLRGLPPVNAAGPGKLENVWFHELTFFAGTGVLF
jgi:hypothetical protein